LPRSKVVAAFQNLSATELLAPDRAMEGDVVVCSDHQEAKERVMALVGIIKNLRGVDGGGLENARYVEQLTALLLSINRIYKAHSSIRIVGV
ncbi:MAG: NADPH-dependent F420 reductase, partial [Chloroflexi bacterium]|nr:NADPH-dependent F420 reductase [Chloroflexota bacterium]